MGIERDYLMRQLMMLFDVIQKIFKSTGKSGPREHQFFHGPANETGRVAKVPELNKMQECIKV